MIRTHRDSRSTTTARRLGCDLGRLVGAYGVFVCLLLLGCSVLASASTSGTLLGPIAGPIGHPGGNGGIDCGGGISSDQPLVPHGTVTLERTENQLTVTITLTGGDPGFSYTIEIFETAFPTCVPNHNDNLTAIPGVILTADASGNGQAQGVLALPRVLPGTATIGDGLGSEAVVVILNFSGSGDRFAAHAIPLPPASTLTLTLDRSFPLPSHPDPRHPRDSFVTATASVKDESGVGIPNYGVVFSSAASNFAASGHTHTNFNQVPLGSFTDSTGTCVVNASGTTASCETDSDGHFSLKYKVPEFSGEFTLKASSVADPSVFDAAAMLVQMPPLLTLSQSLTYRLTGDSGTTQYPGCPNARIEHPSSHYGTAYLLRAIADVASNYAQQTGYTLGVNDMTLIVGGRFDICGDWSQTTFINSSGHQQFTGHFFHRKGTSVDIDGSTVSGQQSQPFDPVLFRTLALFWGLTREPEEPFHFESPF
jgi:hypothetical protein